MSTGRTNSTHTKETNPPDYLLFKDPAVLPGVAIHPAAWYQDPSVLPGIMIHLCCLVPGPTWARSGNIASSLPSGIPSTPATLERVVSQTDLTV